MSAAKRPIDVDAEAALAALRRARKRAERVALATGTCLVEAVDGKPVRVPPRPEGALAGTAGDGGGAE